jgi:hypothetical protein
MVPIISLALGLVAAVRTADALTLGATARTYGVCAATTITNSGATVVNGHIGVNPGSAITGFPPGLATSIQIKSPGAIACNSDAATAYAACLALTPTNIYSGVPLGGKTLTPGVYQFATTAGLNGVLTLDGGGSAASQFIFQIGTGLSIDANSKILLKNLAKACNVFFCIGSSATIGANSMINGTMIAYTSIGVADGVTDVGGFYALNGAVTLIRDTITAPGTC